MSSQTQAESAFPLSAAIVVGGRARRFDGGCKPLEKLSGRAIIDWQLDALSPRCGKIAIVSRSTNSLDSELAARLDHSLEFVADAAVDAGPLAGIAGALDWTPTSWLLVVAGDMPFVDVSLIEHLAAARFEASGTASVDAVAPSVGGRVQPLAALYHKRCAPIIHRLLEQQLLSPAKLFTKPGLVTKTVPLPKHCEHQIRGFNTRAELSLLQEARSSKPVG